MQPNAYTRAAAIALALSFFVITMGASLAMACELDAEQRMIIAESIERRARLRHASGFEATGDEVIDEHIDHVAFIIDHEHFHIRGTSPRASRGSREGLSL